MTIREEFEKAFEKELGYKFDSEYFYDKPNELALWASKWMAEYLAKKADDWNYIEPSKHIPRVIRQLAKELSQ